MELKHLSLASGDIKAASDGSMKFSGYASVFGGVDTYGDTIAQGAFVETLKSRERPIALRWNHYGPVIGKYLSISEDKKGLYVEGELTKGHSVAENVAASLRHGAISGLSIGYYAKDFEIIGGENRLLKAIELVEISVVEDPADNSARITNLKTAISACGSLKEIEMLLRNQVNVSQSEATAIVAAVKSVLNRGDRDDQEKNKIQALKQLQLHALKSFTLNL